MEKVGLAVLYLRLKKPESADIRKLETSSDNDNIRINV